MTQQKLTDDEPDGIRLLTRTTCEVGGVDDEWQTGRLDVGEEIEAAIEDVRSDHSKEIAVNGDGIWRFSVYWNENTDSVWVMRFAYQGGMEVVEEHQ